MTTDCIVNVGVGQWYAKGTARLRRSLIEHGYPGEIMTWMNKLPEGSPTHNENPYAMKVYAMQEAFAKGFTSVFWMDSSAWCIRYPKFHMDELALKGYYFVHSGFNCAQWTNDNALEYFGVTREEAESIPMLQSGVLGINYATEVGREFFAQWRNAMLAGAFKGSWSDHRHDQSCASIIAHRLGMTQHPHQVYDYYYAPVMPETVEIALMGM